MSRALRLAASVAAVCAAAALTPTAAGAATTLDAKLVPAQGAHFGIFGSNPRAGRTWGKEVPYLESLIGRRFDLDRSYYFWDEKFPAFNEYEALKAGRIPVIGWAAQFRDGSARTWGAIANGSQDALIRARADAVKALGKKVFLVFHHEPEDDHAKNGTAADYRAAWRRIVSIFRNRGATNTVFVWNLMAYTFQPDGNEPETYYPGDDVVDWVAADGYNWFGSSWLPYSPWRSFKTVFATFDAWARARNKPGMIAEYGVKEDLKTPDPMRKAAWFDEAAADLKTMPQIKALIYFNGREWPFDSSANAIAGFKRFGADPYFNTLSGPITTTADTSLPSVSITAPAEGSSVVSKTTTTLQASASDNVGVKQVEFWANGSRKCTDTVAPYTCAWYVWNPPGATNYISAVATDLAGNRRETSRQVGTTSTAAAPADTVAPTVKLTSPAYGSTVTRGSTVTIAASAGDDTGVAKVEFLINGVLKCTDTAAPYSCPWTVWTASGSDAWIRARAYDAAGNKSETAYSVRTG